VTSSATKPGTSLRVTYLFDGRNMRVTDVYADLVPLIVG
jgi:hypothetical protein